jgi:hypothetical protein
MEWQNIREKPFHRRWWGKTFVKSHSIDGGEAKHL